MRRLIMTLAAAVTFAVASGFTAQGQKANEVNFGIIATESSANLKQRRPLLKRARTSR